MKDYGAKIFANESKLESLLKLARSNKYSAPKLAKIFNCEKKTISGTLNKFDIQLQNLGRFKKKYRCNQTFFYYLNPTSAYWAGFIAADGCLVVRGKALAVGLRKRDKNHLQKFLNAIKSDYKIYYIQSNNSARIYISSSKLFGSLIKIGITPNKSLRIRNVKIPLCLMGHFIRGLYDGDGSISGRKITHVQFQIAGFEPLLQQVQGVLIKKCKVNKVKIYPLQKNSKTSRLQYTGSQIFRILEFLYKGSNNRIRLKRKYEKYLKFKQKFGR